jgi:hypothetical protein
METVATQIFSQLGFPSRRSLVGMVLSRGVMLHGQLTQAELEMPDSSNRLIKALNYMFEVCALLQAERLASGISPLDAAPLVLIDEAQDLVKDARLRWSGGERVLATLSSSLVLYGVDRQAIRAVIAGSSAELYFALTSPASGARFCYHDLADPTPDAMKDALCARGYTRSDAESMVGLCGTRLRLFDDPLRRGAVAVSVASFLTSSLDIAATDFASVFYSLDTPDSERLARLLDAVSAADDATDVGQATKRPSKMSLWPSVMSLDLAPVLFVDRTRYFNFQSQLHRHSWQAVRGAYSAPPLLLLC